MRCEVVDWIQWPSAGPLAGCGKYNNETSVSTKAEKFVGGLSDWCFLKKEPSPQK
jgi:hypothetical protein